MMKILENKRYREATQQEIALLEQAQDLPYKDRVISRIREKYSVDDELAIIRQRDTKPQEFLEYNRFVEEIKEKEKEKEGC